MSKNVYFASPLFNEMELQFNAQLAQRIRERYPEINLFLPQEQSEINDKSNYADSKLIAQVDTDAVLTSQLLIAVLDGLVVDPGVASEIGVAYQAGIPIIGLYSDTRQAGADNPEKIKALHTIAESQFSYINLYTVGLVKLRGEIVGSSADLIESIEKYL